MPTSPPLTREQKQENRQRLTWVTQSNKTKVAQKWAAFPFTIEMENFTKSPGRFTIKYQSYHISPRKIFLKSVDKHNKLWYNKSIEKDRLQVLKTGRITNMEKYEITFADKTRSTFNTPHEYVAIRMFDSLMNREQRWLTYCSLKRFSNGFINSVSVGNMTLRRTR